MIVFVTFTPETLAPGFEPTANIFLPKRVLFQITHIIAVITKENHTKLCSGNNLPNFDEDIRVSQIIKTCRKTQFL